MNTFLNRFFKVLGERDLAACAELLAAARKEGEIDEAWLDYFQAIILVEQAPPRWDLAREVLDRALAADPPDDLRARLHLEVAFGADFVGDYREAIHHNERSLQLFETLGDRLYQAKVLKNAGIAHIRAWERGQAGKEALHAALACYRHSLEIFQGLGEEQQVGIVEMEMGVVYKAFGQWDEALTHYGASAEKSRRGGRKRDLAITLNNIAEAQLHLGQLHQAEATYREALALLAGLPTPAPLHEIEAYGNLALTLQALDNMEGAIEASDEAIALIESIRGPQQDERSRAGYFGTRVHVYEQRVLLELSRGHDRDALTYLERAKSRAFIDLLAGRALNNGGKTDGDREGEAIRERLSFVLAEPLDAAAIQERLPADTLLVEYFMSQDGASVLLISRNKIQVATLKDDLQQRVQRAFVPGQQRLRHLGPRAGRLHVPFMLAALHHLLIEPIASQLRGWPRLGIIPYGALHYVPFHALFPKDKGLQHPLLGDSRDGPEIYYAPSATVLLDHSLRQPSRQRDRQTQGLVINFGRDLVYAQHEAQAVTQKLGGLLLAGADATRENVLDEGPHYPVLHFACHGFFDADDPLASGLNLADGRLTARQIMQELKLQADLVVLSGCETGRSRHLRGDELMGLVRAFLIAGASAVLVSLWPVDDVSTRILMERFYDGLGAGMTAAGALRRAQLDLMQMTAAELQTWLRADGISPTAIQQQLGRLRSIGDETELSGEREDLVFAHPYYWAPFILVRDQAAGEA